MESPLTLEFGIAFRKLVDGTFIFRNAVTDINVALTLIVKIVENMLEHLNEEKYFKLKKRNKTVTNLCTLTGGREILVMLGGLLKIRDFEEQFVFPYPPSDHQVKEWTEALAILKDYQVRIEQRKLEAQTLKEKLAAQELEKKKIKLQIDLDILDRREKEIEKKERQSYLPKDEPIEKPRRVSAIEEAKARDLEKKRQREAEEEGEGSVHPGVFPRDD